MDVSLENFQAKFVEEALDNIAELETTLLELDLSPRNKELLEKVFRIMHTLKGGGAMFGFEQLSSFAHDLENVYDRIRLGKLSVTSSLLTLTLESVDLLRDLLDREKLASNEMASRCSAMLQLVKTWFEEESEGQKHVASDRGGQTLMVGKLVKQPLGTFIFIRESRSWKMATTSCICWTICPNWGRFTRYLGL